MKTEIASEILHQTVIPIRGKEPFLQFGPNVGLIVNLNDRFGKSHNFVETPFGHTGIPISKLAKGDNLVLTLIREHLVEVPLTRWEKLLRWIRSIYEEQV